mmetsp:Transcript_7134/g.20226  ORF Transcript_7134/g.20226 Transcript_7134/m.20226 type:complete len:216 (+) Transcript_7134:430-1077(+)
MHAGRRRRARAGRLRRGRAGELLRLVPLDPGIAHRARAPRPERLVAPVRRARRRQPAQLGPQAPLRPGLQGPTLRRVRGRRRGALVGHERGHHLGVLHAAEEPERGEHVHSGEAHLPQGLHAQEVQGRAHRPENGPLLLQVLPREQLLRHHVLPRRGWRREVLRRGQGGRPNRLQRQDERRLWPLRQHHLQCHARREVHVDRQPLVGRRRAVHLH